MSERSRCDVKGTLRRRSKVVMKEVIGKKTIRWKDSQIKSRIRALRWDSRTSWNQRLVSADLETGNNRLNNRAPMSAAGEVRSP